MDKIKILIVEDERLVAQDIKVTLERVGYEALPPVATGEDALRVAAEGQPALVLMDIHLAGKMDGITAAKKIIAKNDIPVIYLTAYADEETLQRAKETSPYGYIVKPFEELNLRISIEVAIQKHAAERDKRISEDKLYSLITHASDGIVLTDTKGLITTWNAEMATITGISAEQAYNRPIWDVQAQLNDPQVYAQDSLKDQLEIFFKDILEGRRTPPERLNENRIIRPDGSKSTIQISILSIPTFDGIILGSIGRDISKRIEMEEDLRQSEERHRMLMEQNPASIVVHRKGRVLYANLACVNMLGAKSADELIGQNILDFFHPEVHDRLRETFSDDHLFDYKAVERKIICLDGQVIDTLVAGAHIQYQGKLAVQGVFLDVTERNRIQKALQETQERYHTLYTTMIEGQAVHELIYDQEGQVLDYKLIDVNPAYEKIVGLKRSEVIGKHSKEVYGTETPPYLEIFSKVALSGEATHFETYFPPLDIVFDISVFSPQKGQFVTLFSDITSRKQAEEDNEQYKAELRTLMMISRQLNETTGFEDTLKIILGEAAKHTRASAGSVVITDPAMPQVFLHQGLSEKTINELKNYCPLYTKVKWHECVMLKKHPYQCSSNDGTLNHCFPLKNTGFQAILSIPIKDSDTLLGYLHLYRQNNELFTDADIDFLETLLQQSISAIKKAYLFEKAQHLSVTDVLTQLNNRRQLYVLGRREVERAQRYQTPLSALMIDADHFKKINDNHGHATGDRVLQELAQHLRNSTREVDVLGRYGGEEFTVLLPDTEKAAALELAERLRSRVDQEITLTRLNNHPTLTISIGVASLGQDTPTLESLLDKADAALYTAKGAGRNTVAAK